MLRHVRAAARRNGCGAGSHAQIICYDDEPGVATVSYVVLRLMGYPDVKVLLP